MTTPTPVGRSKALPGIVHKNDFLLRRLHSLSGIVPIGIFVIVHLFTNAQMVWGDLGETFQHEVEFIHLIPGLIITEVALWGAIAFHAIVGVWITYTGVSNTTRYPYADNWRYTMQRVTGILALIFIFLHIAILRWRWDIFGWYTPFYAHPPEHIFTQAQIDAGLHHEMQEVPMSMPLTAYALQVSWLVVVFYVVGVMSVVFHWANGLWTAAITWGLTISTAAMKRWGYACVGLFVLLTAFFLSAMLGALRYDIGQDTTDEQLRVFHMLVPEPVIDINVSGRPSPASMPPLQDMPGNAPARH